MTKKHGVWYQSIRSQELYQLSLLSHYILFFLFQILKIYFVLVLFNISHYHIWVFQNMFNLYSRFYPIVKLLTIKNEVNKYYVCAIQLIIGLFYTRSLSSVCVQSSLLYI